MENNVIDIIMSRRSVREFKPEQIDEELLATVIEAGRAAPSGGNAQLNLKITMSSWKNYETYKNYY